MNRIIGFLILMTGALIAQEQMNIHVELPESYHSVVAGENLWFVIKAANLSMDGNVNATLIYKILDNRKETRASELVSVPLETTMIGHIQLPNNLDQGIYFLHVTLNSSYGNSIAESTFNVVKQPTAAQNIIEHSLFDIIIDIPNNYRHVAPGGELLTSIKLINVGSSGRIDVFLDYQIIGPENKIVLKKRETVAVETQANFVRTFDIPEDASPGHYKIYARITYADGKLADSEYSFTVVKEKGSNMIMYFAAAGILAAVLIVLSMLKYTPAIHNMQMRAKVRRIVRRRLKQ